MLSFKDLPFVLRAREYYVYDEKGKRYLDLYVGGGRYALGHRLPHRLQMVKNIFSKGLFSHYPHDNFFDRRILRAFEKYFSHSINLYLFRDSFSLEKFKKENIKSPNLQEMWEEDLIDFIRFRPFQKKTLKDNCFYSFLLPLPAFMGKVEILVQKIQGKSSLNYTAEEWDFFSQKVLENSVYNLIRIEGEKKSSLKKGDLSFLGREEGFYLVPSYPKEQHNWVYSTLKEEGILISPCYEDPIFLNPFLKEHDIKLISKAVLRLKEKT